MKRASSLKTILLVVLAALAASLIPQRIAVTLTPSVRHRIYLLDRAPSRKSIAPASYVLFKVDSKYLGGSRITIKQVACGEGDMLRVEEALFYCNNVYLGKAKAFSLKGERVEHFNYDGVIPADDLFVFAGHPDSFDSRYFGFVRKDDVLAMAYPLF